MCCVHLSVPIFVFLFYVFAFCLLVDCNRTVIAKWYRHIKSDQDEFTTSTNWLLSMSKKNWTIGWPNPSRFMRFTRKSIFVFFFFISSFFVSVSVDTPRIVNANCKSLSTNYIFVFEQLVVFSSSSSLRVWFPFNFIISQLFISSFHCLIQFWMTLVTFKLFGTLLFFPFSSKHKTIDMWICVRIETLSRLYKWMI